MKIKQLFLAIMVLGVSYSAQAQTTITATGLNGEEEIIDLPEGMEADVDSLLNDYHSRTYLKPASDCNMPDENRTYEPEVYKERLAKLPTIMELPYNDIVQKVIDRYTGRMRRSVAYWLGAQNFYMPIFEEALESYGLPLELKYLPVIESGLNPKAASHAGAVGLWQMILTTGKHYGLEVNSLVDERCDPYKASYAAARLLKDLYRIFGDWNLVIAAYNCGPENVNKAIHRAGGAKDYWKIYPYLPRETRGYVPAFIAANYVMNYYCEHNICPLVTTLPAKSDTVVVNRDLHFEQVAYVTGASIDQIEQLNPQYRRRIINGTTKPSTLCLPGDLVNVFIDNEDSAYTYKASQYLTKRREVTVQNVGDYTVQGNQVTRSSRSGGSTYTNSRRTTTTRTTTSRYSRSTRSTKTATTSKKTTRDRKGKKGKKESSKSVTIKNGDTLSQIAQRNGTTVKKLKQLNGIKGESIRAGKKLKVK